MLPFPRMIEYGNIAPSLPDAYIGTIADIDFSYNDVVNILSPTSTLIGKQTNFRSYKFRHNNIEYILPSQPIALASYKEIYEKGMVWGTSDTGPDIFDASSGVSLTTQNATTSILGSLYRVRLMKGSLTDTVNILSNDPQYYTPRTEWELFVYSIWSNLPSSMTPGYLDVPVNDKIARLNYVTGNTRRWVIVQGSDGSRTTPRCIGRGRFDTNTAAGDYNFSQICSTNISPLWTLGTNIWWPIFERV